MSVVAEAGRGFVLEATVAAVDGVRAAEDADERRCDRDAIHAVPRLFLADDARLDAGAGVARTATDPVRPVGRGASSADAAEDESCDESCDDFLHRSPP